MRQSVPRLRSCRMKAGGAEIRLVHPSRPPEGDVIKARLASAGEVIAVDHFADCGMAGFALVAWSPDGEFCFTYQNGANSPYARATLPSIVADMIRSHMATELTIERMQRG